LEEINSAKFTTDNTGAIGYRMDYSGGLINNESFYLEFLIILLKQKAFFTDHYVRKDLILILMHYRKE
jgi:hypothetical protein